MSTWTDFRDSLEADLDPEIAKGIAFLHSLETIAEGSEVGDIEASAVAGVAAGEAATGTTEQKLVTALEAFGSALVGYAIAIVKQAENPPAPAVPPTA